jgi:hypothetical protein
MDLPAFIRSLAPDTLGAIEAASDLFDEPKGTVKAWLYRERYPKKQTAPKLIARAKGKLSYAGIYAPPRDRAA